jgi:hypothetical protein
MTKIKKKQTQQNKITVKAHSGYPKFCFKYLVNEPKEDPKDRPGFYAEFIVRMKKLSNLGWNSIDLADRHGFGYEKIPLARIKIKNMPSIIAPEVTNLTVFRATGDNRAFLGIRIEDVFHIIFIEENFGDVYDHS